MRSDQSCDGVVSEKIKTVHICFFVLKYKSQKIKKVKFLASKDLEETYEEWTLRHVASAGELWKTGICFNWHLA